MRYDFGYAEEDKLGRPYDVKLLRRLYPVIVQYRGLIFTSIFLVTMITLLELSLPYITKVAIDSYIVPQEKTGQNAVKEAGQERIRYLTVDLTDPDIRDVVERNRFQLDMKAPSARIPFDRLTHLSKDDLSVLRGDDLNGIGIATVVFLGIVVFSFGFNFLQVMVMETAGQRIMHDLRMRLFEQIQSLNLPFFNKNPVGRLVTRVTNDVQNMHELFTSVIVFVFKDLFMLVGITIILLSINWQLALVSFVVLPLVLWASLHFAGRARDVFRILRVRVAEINTDFSETIAGMKVIQIFRKEARKYRVFKKLNHDNYLAGMEQIRVFAIFMPVIEVLGAITVAVVIYYGGYGILADRISIGALAAFLFYMRMFFRPIRDIAEKYNIMQNAMASAERIFLLLDNRQWDEPHGNEKIETGPVTGPGPETVRASNALFKIEEINFDRISFAYTLDVPVLESVSFRIQAGETVAIVGPTGSGKTTLIHLIARFYDPVSGIMRINGKDIRKLSKNAVRSRLALVMQDPYLFSGTLRENIFSGPSPISNEAIFRILSASNCLNFIQRMPDGLDTVLNEGGDSISSGQRQLVSIARALARDPDIILLDEST